MCMSAFVIWQATNFSFNYSNDVTSIVTGISPERSAAMSDDLGDGMMHILLRFCYRALNPANQLEGWKHCNLWHMYHISNWCRILFINSMNWLFQKYWKPTSLVMSHFAIFPWFLLFLIVHWTMSTWRSDNDPEAVWSTWRVLDSQVCHDRSSEDLRWKFWNCPYDPKRSKMEVKFQQIAIKFYILMHWSIFLYPWMFCLSSMCHFCQVWLPMRHLQL